MPIDACATNGTKKSAMPSAGAKRLHAFLKKLMTALHKDIIGCFAMKFFKSRANTIDSTDRRHPE